MKIGILTFHWAANYGAVLQCYALQTYLESLGHNVEVINYKPRKYDDNIFNFLRFRKFLNIAEYRNSKKKEAALAKFRAKHLHQTKRVCSCREVASVANRYDAIISGSDQVANPSFLLFGEGGHTITPTYFLGFPFRGRRIGYALSFGCVKYPEKARQTAAKYIKDFDVITVRENTGIDIVKSMGRNDAVLVPDPTVLMPSGSYHELATVSVPSSCIYCFFLRHIAERKKTVGRVLQDQAVIWNNEDKDYSMEGWLSKIKQSRFVITDSFHCVVMCLKLHVSFAVLTDEEGNVGMNDRLYTLLGTLGIENCIVYKKKVDKISEVMKDEIDWRMIDGKLRNFSNVHEWIAKMLERNNL